MTTTVVISGIYALEVNGWDGAMIELMLDGRFVAEVPWRMGTFVRVDLGATPPVLPTVTRTLTVAPTMLTVTRTPIINATPTYSATQVLTATIWGNCTGSAVGVSVTYLGTPWSAPVAVVSGTYTITVPANVECFLLRDGRIVWTVVSPGLAPGSTKRINLP